MSLTLPGTSVWRGPGRISLRIHRRAALVGAVLAVCALLAGAWSLTLGESALPLTDVVAALLGDADDGTRRIVVDWRLPRVLLALLGGAALALGGAVFQTLTRNPLGSPDVIGFNTGAYTGALVALLVVGGGSLGAVTGALVGGTLTGLLVYLLALRRGLQGYRLIIVGISISALLSAVNGYLMLTARLESAVSAAVWGAGSLNTARWGDLVPVAIALVVVLPWLMAVDAGTRLSSFGDDAARSRGVALGPLRLGLVVAGVALTAVVTAVAGPISFVALVAPQIALRLCRTPGIPLLPTAFLGALLLVVSDLLARTVIAPAQLPVGVVTVVLGGGYLVFLLISLTRRA